MIIEWGKAKVKNYILKGDMFYFSPLRNVIFIPLRNVIFILLYQTFASDPLFR